mgnify:CR=1 FL=1
MSRDHCSVGLTIVSVIGVLEQAKLVAKRQEPEDIRTEVCIRPAVQLGDCSELQARGRRTKKEGRLHMVSTTDVTQRQLQVAVFRNFES